MTKHVDVNLEKGILIVTINRSEKKNAFNRDMYSVFADAFEQVNRDKAVRCMVVKANGDTFCAGNDIGFFLDDYSMAPNEPVGRFLNCLAAVTKPLIAAAQGTAIGLGFTLLLHCDLVFVAEDIRLSAPFARLGLVPEAGSSQLLPALLGQRRAMEIFLLGKVITASDALAFGLANAIVPIARLHEIALNAARTLAELPPEAVYETKRLTRRPLEAINERIKEECMTFMQRVSCEETQMLFKRFLSR